MRIGAQEPPYRADAAAPVSVPAASAAITKAGYISLDASVRNSSGASIRGLKQADFVVDASGKNLPIEFFLENSHPAMSLGILVDESGSMAPKLDSVKQNLAAFVRNLNPADEIFLVAFSGVQIPLQSWTIDREAVVRKLSVLHASGLTSVYGSIVFATGEFKDARYPRKAILLITDGMDDISFTSKEDAVASLKASDARVYAIGIGDPNIKDDALFQPQGPILPPKLNTADFRGSYYPLCFNGVDDKGLKDIASAAGGETIIVPGIDKDGGNGLARALAAISGMIGDSYTIGVALPPGASSSALHVILANHPDAVVTTYALTPPSP